jgi:hypothetical protein
MNLHRWLHPFLRLNILAGLLVFAGLGLHQTLSGPAGATSLNLAVVALFYSYLFWLAEIFTRPVATPAEGDEPGHRSGSV